MPGPLDLTNDKISFTYDRLIQTDGAGNFFDGLGDPVTFGPGGSGSSGSSGTSGTAGSSGSSGSSGSNGYSEFYFQSSVPSPVPSALGARWLNSNTGIEYVWVFDGDDFLWMQPTQLGGAKYQTNVISTSSYSANFSYSYYGVTYVGGLCTVTLPLGTSPSDDGRSIIIADEVGGISYGNRGILVQTTGGQLINGQSSVLMKIERMSLTFIFRNNLWKTI